MVRVLALPLSHGARTGDGRVLGDAHGVLAGNTAYLGGQTALNTALKLAEEIRSHPYAAAAIAGSRTTSSVNA